MVRGLLLFLLITGCAHRQTIRTAQRTFLAVEHQRQEPNLCLPTCASMVLRYYGEDQEPRKLKSMATPPSSTFPGTYARDLLAALRQLGYQWEEQCFPQNAAGWAEGLPRLKRAVFEGHPVLVGIHHPPVGHVVVLVGFDEATHELTFVDPNQDAPGIVTMEEDEFRILWGEDIITARCATFTRPGKSPPATASLPGPR